MNIVIYFLAKKIVVEERKQNAENQLVSCIDDLTEEGIQREFKEFINQENSSVLTFTSSSLEEGFEKLKKQFKYIQAAGGLIEKEGNYLFIYRLKKWDLPKGKLDKGESPEEAAIRECEEECGITQLLITKELNPSYHIYEYKNAYALKKTFWYAMSTKHTKELIPQTEEHIEKVEWFNKDQIQNQVLKSTYPAILDVLKSIT
jgi:8-oxo-dGTP pyrophosphatase MutT (NUDIX family)